MARYFRLPWAVSGDKDPIPDETATSVVSYATGYTQDYQRNPVTDPLARRPERNFFNQALFDITDTLKLYYETGVPPFITAAMNNGTAFSYPIRARVLRGGRIYENTQANNTNTPPGNGWVLVDFSGLQTAFDARYVPIAAGVPLGSCMMWPGTSAPSRWVEARGQSTSGMSQAIISLYGSILPDMRGEFPRGWDNGRNVDSSRPIRSGQTDSFRSHNHGASFSGNRLPDHSHTLSPTIVSSEGTDGNRNRCSGGNNRGNIQVSSASAGTPSGTVTVNTNGGAETRPRNVAWMFIIYVG